YEPGQTRSRMRLGLRPKSLSQSQDRYCALEFLRIRRHKWLINLPALDCVKARTRIARSQQSVPLGFMILRAATQLENGRIHWCSRNSEFISDFNSEFLLKRGRATDDSAQPPAASGITEIRDFSSPQRTVNNSE